MTDKCIKSILALESVRSCSVSELSDNSGFPDDSGEKVKILVIDNDSDKTDQERDELSRRYKDIPEVEILQIKEKAGFSHANNLGYVRIKEQSDFDYLIVANNDITFEQKDFLKNVSENHEKYKWDILSPDVLSSSSGEHQSPIATKGRTKAELNKTIFLNKLFLILLPIAYKIVGKKLKSYKREGFTDRRKTGIVPCGACFVLSKSFIHDEARIFDPETEFYYEEYILHERCRRKGYTIMYDPSMQVIHADGVSTKGRAEKEKQRLKFLLGHTAKSAEVYRKYMYGNEVL